MPADLASAMSAGKLAGKATLGLAGDYPLSGDITVEKLDLDAFIQAALHLQPLTGHGSVDGRFQISGALAHPETIAVDVGLSRVSFEYERLRLENSSPIPLRHTRASPRVEPAPLPGPDTDFHLAVAPHF